MLSAAKVRGRTLTLTTLATRRFYNSKSTVSTTNRHFRERALKPRAPLKGLWLTGQDACSARIAGGLLGGVFCLRLGDPQNEILKTVSAG